jgi:hypothetical protein
MYLLTAIDRSTRWVKAVPMRNMEASRCTDAFIANWVALVGVPSTVTTDRGTQFPSAVWTSAFTQLGIKHVVLTTAFHPQSNRMVERVHRQIKDACMWSRHNVAHSSTLGAVGAMCGAQEIFSCVTQNHNLTQKEKEANYL